MSVTTIDGNSFANMLLLGAHHLRDNAKRIDALNVFPVPDGDTGTNMNLTITSGANAVKDAAHDHVGNIANAFAKGLLMGARGNSGVILSQLFRGFAKALEDKAVLNAADLAAAIDAGVVTAYKAVMKPVEGTILTVAKDAAAAGKAAVERHADNPTALFEEVLKAAKHALNRTPELLPVLKEVGVVDSGGQGLVTIYEGFLASLKGEQPPEGLEDVGIEKMINAEHHMLAQDFMDTKDITYGYCTEFMVKFEPDKLDKNPFSEASYREALSEHGDSLLVVADEDLVKVHIHAEYPGNVLTYSQQYGSLINLKIENMREQHTAIVGKPKEKQPYGIVTVAMGEGIHTLLENLGATVVLAGGQTMNPSTQDISEAIQQANAEHVFILPNNKNIVMAAEQAADLADEDVTVIPSKTIPQGMSALLAFQETQNPQQNAEAMKSAIAQVKSGQVTHAVRNTTIDGVEIKEGQFLGIAEGKIVLAADSSRAALEQLLAEMITEDDELITLLYGEEADENTVSGLETFIEETYPDAELEMHEGKQPIYPYLIAVE